MDKINITNSSSETINLVNEYLTERDRPLKPDIKITFDIQEALLNYQSYKAKSAFQKTTDKEGENKWIVETVCDGCNAKTDKLMSKTQMLNYIFRHKGKQKENNLCDSCKHSYKIEEKKRLDSERHNQNIADKEFADSMIGIFLNRLFYKNKDSKSRRNQFASIKNFYLFFNDRIDEALEETTYHEYIKSDWWKVIAQEARRRAKFKCQLCGCSGNLNVHHKEYTHLYYEPRHMDSLIVLCRSCHARHHEVGEL